MPTLHLTPDSTRFFIIPDGQILPPGEFLVRTVDKRELRVSEDALREFEISQEQGGALLREEMKQALKQAWRGLVNEAEKDEEPDAPKPQAEKLLRDVMQWPAGEELNERHLLNAARPLLTLLSETLTVAASADPAAQAQAQNRLTELREKLEGYDFSLGDAKIEDLPAKLAGWREGGASVEEREKVAALLSRLKELGDQASA